MKHRIYKRYKTRKKGGQHYWTRYKTMQPTPIHTLPKTFDRMIGEGKFDGTRTIAYIKNSKARFINRRGIDKTNIYPELQELPRYIKGDAVLDGEVVVLDHSSPYGDFNRLATRDHLQDKELIKQRSKSTPLTYVAFDVLEKGGKNITHLSLMTRKKILDNLIKPNKIIKEAEYTNKPDELIKKIKKANAEGIVLKNINSKYIQKKTNEWRKLKLLKENDVAIIGITPGTGKRKNLFGALKMGVQTPKGVKYVGKVGTGFSDSELKEIKQKMDKGEKLVARVSYQRMGSRGKYFSPHFIGLREDITQRDTHV